MTAEALPQLLMWALEEEAPKAAPQPNPEPEQPANPPTPQTTETPVEAKPEVEEVAFEAIIADVNAILEHPDSITNLVALGYDEEELIGLDAIDPAEHEMDAASATMLFDPLEPLPSICP